MTDLLDIAVDGEKLRKARKRAKLSLENAGKAVGVTRQGLAQIETTGNTKSDILIRLLKLYDLLHRADEIIGKDAV